MYKVIIKDLNAKEIGGFQKETIEQVNEYLALIDAKERPWHQPKEGEYAEIPIGAILFEEKQTFDEFDRCYISFVLPKHYEVEITNLDLDYDYQLQECYRKRRAEMPNADEVAEAIFEKFAENRSEKFEQLQARRMQVKNKHPKPIKQ